MAASVRTIDVPSLARALRLAADDWYYHSLVMLAANVVWGITLVVTWLAVLVHPALGILMAIVLALPTAGTFRVAASIVRGEGATLRDALAWNHRAGAILFLGALVVGALLVAGVDLALGITAGSLVGIGLATLAVWASVAVVVIACCCWPLLCDPYRKDATVRTSLRFSGLVCLSSTRLIVGSLMVSTALLAVSAVLFVALLTISLGYVALLLCRIVLPLADRLDPIGSR